MNDFDDALRAGIISPGSSPFVEEKPAPAADQANVKSGTTVTEEARTTEVAAVEVRSRLQKAHVLIVSHDHAAAMRVKDAISAECATTVATDPRPLEQGRFDLVVLAGVHFNGVPELRVPAVLIAGPDALARAQSVIAGRRAAVVASPYAPAELLARVQELIGAYVEPW